MHGFTNFLLSNMKRIFVLLWILFAATSWFTNLYKFVNCDFEAPYKAEALHGIGVVTPVNLVTAWSDLGK